MNTVSLEMESFRLAAYTVPCPCYICGGGNNFDSEMCRHCHAPMALAHQANTQKIHPRMIAAIGPSGAGKTVYLGMLTDMLGLKAKYRDTAWQLNEFAPYMDKYNEAREQIGAGQQNVFSALDSLSALGVQAASLANARNSQVSPSQAAQYTSSQTGSAAMMQQLLQGTTDTMSWPGQQGVQNKYANQFMQGLGLLNKVWK